MRYKIYRYVGFMAYMGKEGKSCAFALKVAQRTDDIMPSKNIDYFQDRYYVFNRRLLTFVGLWPYQESSKRLVRARLINFIVIVPILFQVKEMLDRINSDWVMLENQRELMIMQKYAKIGRLCTLVIAFIFYLTIIFLLFPYILYNSSYNFDDTQLVLLFYTNYICKNKICYYFILLIFCVLTSIICAVGVTHYSMYALFVQHTCALLNIVTVKIEQRIQRKSNHFRSESVLRKEYNSVVSVIQYYTDAIKVINLINSIYRRTYLIELIFALIIIIMDFFHFFQLLALTGKKGKILSNCIYIIGSIFMTYVGCYSGQRVIDHNTNITRKIYQVSFYKLSIKTQKALLLLTMKVMNPCHFSMMGTMVTSHKLFLNIIQKSFSFAMVFYKTC